MGSIDDPDVPLTVTAEDRIVALSTMADLVPGIVDLDIVDEWRGVLTTTPPRAPVPGPIGPEGHFVATGFSGHGLMLAPPAGRMLADVILEGRSDMMDLKSLSPGHFEAGPLTLEEKFAADESV